LTGKKTGLMS